MAIASDPTARTKINPIIAFVAALLIVLIAGLIDLRKPFSGDQALFVTGARAMINGSSLYRDFWDLKQPAIYWFYWLAIHGPGSAEVAVHSLEVVCFLAFAGVIMASLRGYFRKPATAALAAVLCCAVYFVICGSWHLTQVEGLVGFPLYLSAWLLLKTNPSDPLSLRRIFLAGMAAALVALFKLMLAILPICFLLLLIVSNLYHCRALLRSLVAILIFGLGVALILFPVLIFYDSNHQLPLIYRTFIENPARITRELPHNKLEVLKAGIVWFLLRIGPLAILALIGLKGRAGDLFCRGMLAWILVGFALILMQRMGWEYHFLLLLCPIAILAAAGVETIMESPDARRGWIAIPILLLLPYVGMGSVQALRQLYDPRPAFYRNPTADAAILFAPGASPGPIYVLGDPLIYYLSGRAQAVAINGWSPEWLLNDQWQDLAFRLRMASPRYIFVAFENDPVLALRGQVFTKLLKDNYRQISSTDRGNWYVRKA